MEVGDIYQFSNYVYRLIIEINNDLVVVYDPQTRFRPWTLTKKYMYETYTLVTISMREELPNDV